MNFTLAVVRFDRRAPRRADRQDGRVRRIDDRRELAHTVHAQIGDGARTALIFVGLEFFLARTVGEIAHFGGNCGDRFAVGVADHRRDQPAVERDRDADIGIAEAQDTVARPDRIGAGNALQRRRPGLDDEIIERKLECRLARLVFRRGGIRLFAHRDQPAGIEIGREIEMRNCLLGLDQPRRDGAAHRVRAALPRRQCPRTAP